MPVLAILETWLTALPWVVLWATAAAGFGRLVRPLLPAAGRGAAVQTATGAALLLTLDAAAGRLGLLAIGGGAGAWILALGGVVLLVDQVRRIPDGTIRFRLHPMWAAALPAVTALLLAAASAPGWLWASEFGGYDVLSYHLLLPREWMTLGASGGLDHNVYAHLPSYVENAYLHLAHLRGDAVAVAPACQLLHAGFALLTAALVARLVAPALGSGAAAAAGVVVLGTPWVVVAGSLAYDEMAACAFLAAGLVVLSATRPEETGAPTGSALGLLAAAACGAKLTAVGFVALPLGLLLTVATAPVRGRLVALAAAAAVGTVVLAPWWLGNALDTGNPFFPLLTEIFGTGHWSPEQAARFAAGHGSGLDLAARLAAGWNEFARFGLGPNPAPGAPWSPQWSVLPWLALGGALVAARRPSLRGPVGRCGIVAVVQIVFWVAFTHVKSRFLLPFVVPGAVLTVLGGASVLPAGRVRGVVAVVLLLAWCALPATLLARERDGRPLTAVGALDAFDGSLHAALIARGGPDLPPSDVIRAEAPPAWWINRALPDGSRVAGVGAAARFYFRPERMGYATVWDRGPLERALDASGDDLDAAFRALRRAGFTHMLVDGTMLANWRARGWSDPRLDVATVQAAADRDLGIVKRFPGAVALYRLPGTP